MAAPVGGQIFSEILPYLEVNQGNEDEIEQLEEVKTPDVVGKTLKEANKILKENGLEMVVENESEELNKDETIVSEQIPKAGIMINKTNKVYVQY